MSNNNAGEPATQAGDGQEPSGVSNQEKPAQDQKSNASEGDKTQKEDLDTTASDDSKGSKEDDPSKEGKMPPFHTHPAWKRQQRQLNQTRTLVKEQSAALSELLDVVKEMKAKSEGQEYKSEKAGDDKDWPNFDEVLDAEMDKLSETANLDAEQETAIMDIAKKYAYEVEPGKKVYIPAPIAFRIYQDLEKAKVPVKKEPESKQSKSPTKPSAGGKEGEVAKLQFKKPNETFSSLDQVIERAKRLAEVAVD